jgi:hypothetical protein
MRREASTWLEQQREQIAAKEGNAAAEEWYQDWLKQRERYLRAVADREFGKYADKKAEYVADKLLEVIGTSTARYEDLPRDHSPIAGLNRFEWGQVLAIIERHRDEIAARYVERFTMSRKAKHLHSDLTYLLRFPQYAEIAKLQFYIPRLRLAKHNLEGIADGIEAEQERKRA